MTVIVFPEKERLRFRKLLEVAHSTSYSGEREAALGAAARLAEAHGMTLREAAGMKDAPEKKKPTVQAKRPRGFRADFGAAGPDSMGAWWTPREKNARGERHLDGDAVAADKRRREEAFADALQRGLDGDEIAAEERKKEAPKRGYTRSKSRSSWRPRPEFVRVLLKETRMSAKEIAAVAGVTIYDVFREKLLMRRAETVN